jgi:hypothetical protein
MRRPSSSSLCRENSPEARRAPFSVASSNCEKGSRFSLSVPLSSSGWDHLSVQLTSRESTKYPRSYRLGNDGDARTESIQVDRAGEFVVVVYTAFGEDAA